MTLDEALTHLKPYGAKTINIGMSAQQIWIRLQPSQQEYQNGKAIIYLSSPLIEKMTIYRSKDNKKYSFYKRYTYLQREHGSPFVYFNLGEGSGKESFVIHLEPRYMPIDFSLKIASKEHFFNKNLYYLIENIALIGFVLALALYSFFIYFFTKDKSYLYYSFYLLFLIWHQITYVGLTPVIAPYSFTLFDSNVINLKIGLVLVTSILYAIHFLKVKRDSTIYRLYFSYFIIAIVVVAVAATIGLNANIIVSIALAYVFFNFIAGVIAYKNGVKEARLFIVGFGIVGICYTVAILDALGFISLIEQRPNILLYATALEALILSVAFADRYMILQKEKEQINQLRLQESRDRTKIIEKKVEEKTHKLNSALKTKEMLIKEVHHRVKNNLQIILSMLRMQSFSSKSSEVKKKLQDLENRINAIAKSYEMLLITENIEEIDMNSYITALVNDIAQAYNFKKHHINIIRDIDATIPLKQAVYIGLIINELITNAYEHGEIIVADSYIYLSFKKVDGVYQLIVEDNCGGTIPSNSKEFGLGLKFIDALVRNQLDGSYTIENKRVTIKIKL